MQSHRVQTWRAIDGSTGTELQGLIMTVTDQCLSVAAALDWLICPTKRGQSERLSSVRSNMFFSYFGWKPLVRAVKSLRVVTPSQRRQFLHFPADVTANEATFTSMCRLYRVSEWCNGQPLSLSVSHSGTFYRGWFHWEPCVHESWWEIDFNHSEGCHTSHSSCELCLLFPESAAPRREGSSRRTAMQFSFVLIIS